MLWNRTAFSRAEHLKLYLFLSALAVNFFLEVIIIANVLSIQYFFYATPMIIRIDFLSTLGNTLLWIASLCLVYITKEVVEETPHFRRVNRFLETALVGSFFLLFSVFLTLLSPTAEPAVKLILNQLWFFTVSIGYPLSFAGSSLALFTIITQNKSVLRLFLIYLFSLLIPIEIWSLTHWVAYPFNITSYLGFAWQGAFIELQLFYLSYPLIFWLFIAFLFSWVWMPLVKFGKDKIRQKKGIHTFLAFLFGSQNTTKPPNGATYQKLSDRKDDISRGSSPNHLPIAVLLGSLFFGVFIAYYPYLNPQSGLVGWDSLGYYLSLTGMVNKDFYGTVQFAATTDRPLYFLLLYLFRSLTQLPPNVIIELMPVVTILANALAIFWFVKIGEKNALVASIAAVLSIFSFNTTIAMHAGTLANWLAMALGFTMFGLVLKLQEKMSLKFIFATILASASAFLIHYWSGAFFLMILGCYVFLMFLQRRAPNTKLILLLLASAILIALFLSGLTSDVFASYGSAENTGLTEVLVIFWTKLPIFIDSWFFGALANPVIIALALIGIAACFYQKTNFSRILISWTVVGSLLSIFVSPIGRNTNQWIMWRAIYLIPFQIPAALGLFYLIAKLGTLKQSQHSVKGNSEDIRDVKSSSFAKNENFKVFFYLIIDYGVSALLLILDFPILGALILLNYLFLTLIVHFKVRKRDDSSILVFIFAMFVILLLFNYALRTLAPLTVHRMQP